MNGARANVATTVWPAGRSTDRPEDRYHEGSRLAAPLARPLSGNGVRFPTSQLATWRRMDLLAELDARGLIHDTTDRDELAARLAEGNDRVYIGFDPTADSLHVGHLVGQLFLRRFQLAGHRPFPLAGGATGMVGDPGGRSEERNLLDNDTLRHNVERIKRQLTSLLDFEPGPFQATLVNNADWTAPIAMLDFLRDVGKHVTVNQMIAKDSVKARLEGEHGISLHRVQLHAVAGQRLPAPVRAPGWSCRSAAPTSGATSSPASTSSAAASAGRRSP